MALRPKFSIITVTYNASAVIEPTLRSVAVQSYKNYEYLLIDGASTDDTVTKAVATGMEFAHIVSEGDSGLYDAMNKGIALATGDYLCFLNAGDALYVGKLHTRSHSLAHGVVGGGTVYEKILVVLIALCSNALQRGFYDRRCIIGNRYYGKFWS